MKEVSALQANAAHEIGVDVATKLNIFDPSYKATRSIHSDTTLAKSSASKNTKVGQGINIKIDVDSNTRMGISEKAVAERFSKAASRYDRLAAIQHSIAEQGLRNLPVRLNGVALDIGCGTGVHTQSLNNRGLQAVGVDIAEGMLALAGNNYPHLTFKQGSAQALPFDSNTIDVAYSSMALQWANSPSCVAKEIHRVLKNGAIAELAIMVSGSFEELTRARRVAQLPTATTPLPTGTTWYAAFRDTKLAVKRIITRDYVDSHSDMMSLLRSVKGIGAGETGKQQKMLSRQDIQKLSKAYPKIHSKVACFPLTYRVCHFRLEKHA
ncbi:methyltransferase domain-containing protein [Alteromonas sp. BMJM2]|uniref:methyltransferase domain-containing protein n=1 Tax=Alteromonas sp. BMJM2 TaxID=2954241 RepID=UPI0022B5136D|nr:methyltransferase domain-containing protein [Alteromonas sp. BMJM2]